jgi:hypothetical protein
MNGVDPKDGEQDVSEHEEGPDPVDGSSSPAGGTRKKKQKSKAAQVLNALRGKNEVPQELVDRVLDQVKDQQGEGSSADSDNVRAVLEQLKIMDVLQGKSGIGGKNKKDMGEHKVIILVFSNISLTYGPKFWRTQPVPQLGEFFAFACVLQLSLTHLQARCHRKLMVLSSPPNRTMKSEKSHGHFPGSLNGQRLTSRTPNRLAS